MAGHIKQGVTKKPSLHDTDHFPLLTGDLVPIRLLQLSILLLEGLLKYVPPLLQFSKFVFMFLDLLSTQLSVLLNQIKHKHLTFFLFNFRSEQQLRSIILILLQVLVQINHDMEINIVQFVRVHQKEVGQLFHLSTVLLIHIDVVRQAQLLAHNINYSLLDILLLENLFLIVNLVL